MTSVLDDTTATGAAPRLDDRDPVVRLACLAEPATLTVSDVCDGAAWGFGRLDGTRAVVFATDPRTQGGALGEQGCALIVDAYERALDLDLPIVGVWHSGGARLKEGARSLHAVGQVFSAMTRASGRIPQVSLVVGPAAGGAAYGPALTDVVVLTPDARVFVTGPDVVRSVTGEDLTAEQLGGPGMHGPTSGVAHVTTSDDEDAVEHTRRITALLARRVAAAPDEATRPDPALFLPQQRKRVYDIHPVIAAVLDGPGEELQAEWSANVVTLLGRLRGQTVGVVANNPARDFGCLTGPASDKAARFVRLCDAFGIPLLVLVDVPGYLPGAAQESEGILRRGAKLLHAFAGASVPRVSVVLRRAFGGAYIAMNSRSLGATRAFAWPDAEVDVMNPVSAVRILRRRDLAGLEGAEKTAAEELFAAEHAEVTGGLAVAVDEGFIDEVLEPSRTRAAVASALLAAEPVRGRLTNIPL
ncbi:MAG: acetyl-CoA/propionyl-CoA carboxylase carboxyl transferase subunit [Frankiaceae bacterium]|nr:acetyl-CoA/propionyl-CoA carboxylase carboxyl transferase subunit [Frankiaceae bacterium]